MDILLRGGDLICSYTTDSLSVVTPLPCSLRKKVLLAYLKVETRKLSKEMQEVGWESGKYISFLLTEFLFNLPKSSVLFFPCVDYKDNKYSFAIINIIVTVM